MRLEDAVDQVLEPYMRRVQVRAGNGLSSNMNKCLRTYAEIPLMIRRAVTLLAGLEAAFGFEGNAHFNTFELYKSLLAVHDDWVAEVPRVRRSWALDRFTAAYLSGVECAEAADSTADGDLVFVRVPRLDYQPFSAAWTIAKKIGILHGWGEVRLSRRVLADLKELVDKAPRAVS